MEQQKSILFDSITEGVDRVEHAVGKEQFETVSTSGGKFLLTNIASKSPSSPLTAPIPAAVPSFPDSSAGIHGPH